MKVMFKSMLVVLIALAAESLLARGMSDQAVAKANQAATAAANAKAAANVATAAALAECLATNGQVTSDSLDALKAKQTTIQTQYNQLIHKYGYDTDAADQAKGKQLSQAQDLIMKQPADLRDAQVQLLIISNQIAQIQEKQK